jgi:hypothetical protein
VEAVLCGSSNNTRWRDDPASSATIGLAALSLNPCELIERDMGELFRCAPVNGYTRIRTPYLYPDGDVIDLYLARDGVTLTDLGETLSWLRQQTVSDKMTVKQRQLIDDVVLNHGVEFYQGMLVARVRDPRELAPTVTRLSQSALRVADLYFTFRGRTASSITDEVQEFLEAREIGFEPGEKLPGRTGHMWTVDFHTRTPQRSTLVIVLSTGSRARARQIAEHTFAAWYDLSYLRIGPEGMRFVSLFDDELDVWASEDFELVAEVSDVSFWSRRDEFAELLVS